jgi:hypothetical protein
MRSGDSLPAAFLLKCSGVRCEHWRCSRPDQGWRISHNGAAMPVARDTEISGRILTEQSEIGRMGSVRDRQRAAEMVAGFGESDLRAFSEDDVPRVDFLRHSMRRSKAGDQAAEALRCVELEVPSGAREGDRPATSRASQRHFQRSSVYRCAARDAAGRYVFQAAAADNRAARDPTELYDLRAATMRTIV